MSLPPDNRHPAFLEDQPEPKGSGRTKMTVYPVTLPTGEGWIGLHGKAITWFSLGTLDTDAVEAYWKGPVKRGRKCPIDTEHLEEAAKGKNALPLAPLGTPFQKEVWQHLLRIPFGVTRTYGEIAADLGSPKRARAVGTAVAANPIAWIIPCHRVLPANGSIGNYHWGAANKEKLLTWERSQQGSGLKDLLPAEEGKLEEMLLKAQRFEDIAKLSGDIAHDLNNLLAPIRMATQLLKRNNSDEALNRYIDIIETSTGRARSVVQEILNFSRETESGKEQVVDVDELVREIITIGKTTCPKRIQLKSVHKAGAPRVRMDPSQLHRVIMNLLVNARDAIGGEGRITVQVSAHDLELQVRAGKRQLNPGRFVCISVNDTGCGISDEIRDRIFDPFFTTKPKEQGTGLGLSSVYGIIARTGGFVDLETRAREGSTFHVFIPQADD